MTELRRRDDLEVFSDLCAEFGSAAILYALASGELLGYTFSTWKAMDARIAEWAEIMGVSRSRVFEEWKSIWLELGRAAPAAAQHDAFLRAAEVYEATQARSEAARLEKKKS